MAVKDTTGKTAYMYDAVTDKWYAVAGLVNTAAAYTWTGTNNFNNTVSANDALIAKAGVNNFLNPAARDAAIPSPVAGLVCFIRNDANGATYNKLEYYTGTTWLSVGRFSVKSVTLTVGGSYTLTADDDMKLLKIPSSATIFIPTNSVLPLPVGYRVELFQSSAEKFAAGSESGGISVYSSSSSSVNPSLRSSKQYGTVVLTKIDTNSWLMNGDLEDIPASPTPAPVSAPVSSPVSSPVVSPVPVPVPAPVTAPTLGIWYSYCETTSNASLDPMFTSSQTCSQMQTLLTSMGEIDSHWTCATGYSNSPTISAPDCGSASPTPTPVAPTPSPVSICANPDILNSTQCTGCGYYWSSTYGECSTTPWTPVTSPVPAPAPVAPSPAPVTAPAPTPAAPTPAPAQSCGPYPQGSAPGECICQNGTWLC